MSFNSSFLGSGSLHIPIVRQSSYIHNGREAQFDEDIKLSADMIPRGQIINSVGEGF